MATKPTKKPAGPVTTYTVLSPLEHDQEPYAVGESIELTPEQAAPLLGVKAIEPAPAQAAA
jgi:hypothetical protein